MRLSQSWSSQARPSRLPALLLALMASSVPRWAAARQLTSAPKEWESTVLNDKTFYKKPEGVGGAPIEVAVSTGGGRDTNTVSSVYVTHSEGSLVGWARDVETGKLSDAKIYHDGFDDPRIIEISPDGSKLFVGDRTNDYRKLQGPVSVFNRDPKTGSLTFLQRLYLLEGVCTGPNLNSCLFLGLKTIVISPDGRFLYALRVYGEIYSFSLDALDASPDGQCFAKTEDTDASGAAACWSPKKHIGVKDPEDGLGWLPANMVIPSDGRSMLLSLSNGTVVSYNRDPVSGIIGEVTKYLAPNAEAGTNPISHMPLAVSKDGRFVFGFSSSNTPQDHYYAYVYERNLKTGTLTKRREMPMWVGDREVMNLGNAPLNPWWIEVVDASLYISCRLPGALYAFNMDIKTGELAKPCLTESYGKYVGHFDASPDGRHLYLTGAVDGSLASFSRRAARAWPATDESGYPSWIKKEFQEPRCSGIPKAYTPPVQYHASSSNENSDKERSSENHTVGIILGIFSYCTGVIFIFVIYFRWRRKNKQGKEEIGSDASLETVSRSEPASDMTAGGDASEQKEVENPLNVL